MNIAGNFQLGDKVWLRKDPRTGEFITPGRKIAHEDFLFEDVYQKDYIVQSVDIIDVNGTIVYHICNPFFHMVDYFTRVPKDCLMSSLQRNTINGNDKIQYYIDTLKLGMRAFEKTIYYDTDGAVALRNNTFDLLKILGEISKYLRTECDDTNFSKFDHHVICFIQNLDSLNHIKNEFYDTTILKECLSEIVNTFVDCLQSSILSTVNQKYDNRRETNMKKVVNILPANLTLTSKDGSGDDEDIIFINPKEAEKMNLAAGDIVNVEKIISDPVRKYSVRNEI